MDNQYVFGDEPEETVTQRAMKEALERAGVLKKEEKGSQPQPSFDLKASLAQLQADLSRFTGLPTTVEEVKAYDQGLQELACQVAPRVLEVEAFLASVKEAGLREEPAFEEQVTQAEEYLRQLEDRPAVRRYVNQVKAFLSLSKVRGFRELRERLEGLTEQGLAFKARRDPEIPLQPKAVLSRENGEEFVYLPHDKSRISQLLWEQVTATRDRVLEARAERREAIQEALEAFKAQATPGLSVYKAVHEEAEGILFLSTSFEDRKTGRQRPARMLIRVSRGSFTIWQVFEPDRIEFILAASRRRNRDGTINWDNPQWFPLYPPRFEERRVPQVIAEIVCPVLRNWYDNEARQREALVKSREILAKSEISLLELQAGKPGYCAIYIRDARSSRRGPDDLTLGLRGTGDGTCILEEYISLRGVFAFEAIKGLEVSLEEPEEEVEISPEWQKTAIQAKILRGFLKLAANRQRSAEIQAKKGTLEPLVTVTEGLEGKAGHSLFHIPRAQTESRGPAHLTCHIEWQEEGFILQEYHSWVDPWARSRGPIELNQALDKLISRQPVEDEEPVIQVLRHLLQERREYEAWKASQEIPEEEEGENGPPSNNN